MLFSARIRTIIIVFLLLTGIVEGALAHKLPIRERSYLVARQADDKNPKSRIYGLLSKPRVGNIIRLPKFGAKKTKKNGTGGRIDVSSIRVIHNDGATRLGPGSKVSFCS